MTSITITDEFKQAKSALRENLGPVFVTGKAGVGKSHLVRWLSESYKNCVLTSTTAISAQQFGGVTVHSQFGLGFKPDPYDLPKLQPLKQLVLDRVDLLVIDEVGMLLPNILDCVDRRMRAVRKKNIPFGGVRVLLVGDLLQIPPVLGSDRAEILSLYQTPFFFSANVFSECSMTCVELTRVFRQNDVEMVEHLARIRMASDYRDALAYFNNRCWKDRQTEAVDEDCLKLVTRNFQVDAFNAEGLGRLPGKLCVFKGDLTGTYLKQMESQTSGEPGRKEKRLPVPLTLHLKEGARVIFKRNTEDFSNGSTGTIVKIDVEAKRVDVKLDAGGRTLAVEPAVWEDRAYAAKQGAEIESVVLGTFTQFPMNLAYAVSIHSSQGMSLDAAYLDFSGGVFDDGLCYVGLSRCKTIGGLRLAHPLSMKMVRANKNALMFWDAVTSGHSWRDLPFQNDFFFVG